MAQTFIAVMEQREGIIKKTSFEVLSKAAELAAAEGGLAYGILIGGTIEGIDKALVCGASKVIHYSNDELTFYAAEAYRDIILRAAAELNADVLLFPNTALGKDLAPRAAARLNAGIAADCVKLEVSDGKLTALRPVFAGKALQSIRLLTEKKVFTLRPNVFPAAYSSSPASFDVVPVGMLPVKTKVISLKKAEGKLDVAEADIIVSGGRGMKEASNFVLIEQLAETLGAAVGASRAVVDAGWRPHGEQVGQTGKTVSPSVYFACGISGAIQHLAGMSSSKVIVAINKDKDAPIFGIADYGIQGDLFEILPVLTAELRKLKS